MKKLNSDQFKILMANLGVKRTNSQSFNKVICGISMPKHLLKVFRTEAKNFGTYSDYIEFLLKNFSPSKKLEFNMLLNNNEVKEFKNLNNIEVVKLRKKDYIFSSIHLKVETLNTLNRLTKQLNLSRSSIIRIMHEAYQNENR